MKNIKRRLLALLLAGALLLSMLPAFADAAGVEGTHGLTFTRNLVPVQLRYMQGANAETLTVEAVCGDCTVLYQWYSSGENPEYPGSPDILNRVAIEGANTNSFTPPTDTVGDWFYFAGMGAGNRARRRRCGSNACAGDYGRTGNDRRTGSNGRTGDHGGTGSDR